MSIIFDQSPNLYSSPLMTMIIKPLSKQTVPVFQQVIEVGKVLTAILGKD